VAASESRTAREATLVPRPYLPPIAGRGETRLERRGNEMTIEYIIEERRGTVRESMGPGGLST
jgi:hypothetical protein